MVNLVMKFLNLHLNVSLLCTNLSDKIVTVREYSPRVMSWTPYLTLIHVLVAITPSSERFLCYVRFVNSLRSRKHYA